MSRAPIQLPLADHATRKSRLQLAQNLATVALAFCLVVVSIMIVDFVRDQQGSPLIVTDAQASSTDALVRRLSQLNRDLADHPESVPLKQQIRQADLEIRQRHFDRRHRLERGAWMLVGGVALLLLSLKATTQLQPVAPGMMTEFPPLADTFAASAVARRSMLVVSGLFIGVLAMLPLTSKSSFSSLVANTNDAQPRPDQPSSAQVAAPLPTRQQWLGNWPTFRGPSGCGIVDASIPWPAQWDGTSGQNILWKIAVPLPGQNSPIIWNDRIFLSGATAKTQEVFCFSLTDGSLKWRRAVTGPVPGESLTVDGETGFAAPTMATDGLRVYAIFATGDIAAFDLDGQPLWSRNLGKPSSQYGYASSLAIHRDRVIVQFDQGHSETEKLSVILAIDGATGKTVWKTPRPVSAAWSSPIVIQPEKGAQVIACGKPWVMAFDPQDGKEIWRADALEGDVAASPAFASGHVFTANDQAKLAAIAIDGHGEVTTTHVKWTADEGMPDIVSPLATDEIVLLVQSGGLVTCYDARDGKPLWNHEFAASFHSSPVVIGKMIYLIDRAGVTHFLDAGPVFKEISTCALGEPVSASPAFAGGKMILRGRSNLYCIGSK